VEILKLTRDGYEVVAKVAARSGELVVLDGDRDAVERHLDEPLKIFLDRFRTPLEFDREGDAEIVFIDGRIDPANWVDALPESLSGSYVRARRA